MSYYDVHDKLGKFEGKRLDSITLSGDKETITITAEDGTTLRLGVEGDCCSSSWVEHLEGPSVKGATFLGFESGGSIDLTDDDKENPVVDDRDYRTHECLQRYQDTFRTSAGDVTLEYRNSSNGYYGGYLVVLG